MRPIRVAFDYRPALLGSSGIPRAARELARALTAVPGIDLRAFGHCLARARRPPDPSVAARLRRWPLPGRTHRALARLGLDAGRLAGGADVFHWTDYVHPPVGPRTRVVCTLHDCAFLHPGLHPPAQASWLAAATRRAVERADAVVCPSRAIADEAAERLDVPRERLRVIGFGADHVPQAAPRSRAGPRHVLALGTVEPRKNFGALLAAWRALGPDRPALVVVGRPGWEAPETTRALLDAAAAGEITWLHAPPDDVVFDLLERAAVLAYPSSYEGFGFPPLEALALRVPVVAGDAPVLREVLGDAPFYCDPHDTEAVRAALEAALAADPQRTALGAGRAARFTWAECARRHAALYREVVG